MGGGGEHRHVDADLGDDVPGADGPDAGHGVELLDLGQVRLGQLLDGGGELTDLGSVVVDDRQHHCQHGGVLAGEERAVRCLFQPADLAAHLPAGQGRERVRVALPGGQRVEHVPAGDAVDVGDHRRELQVPFPELRNDHGSWVQADVLGVKEGGVTVLPGPQGQRWGL